MNKCGNGTPYICNSVNKCENGTPYLRESLQLEWAYVKGSSLSPDLFDMILDVGTKEQSSWCILFANEIVMCSTRIEHTERKLEEWRRAVEER